MKRVLLSVMGAAAIALPAAADTIDVLYKNTLTLRDTQGRTTTVLVSEGGQMEQLNAAGMWAAGFWTLEGDRFCWTARGEAELCVPLPPDKGVGDAWEISGPTGKVVWAAEVLAGRADLRNPPGEAASGSGDH